MAANSQDKIIFGVAVVALLGAAGWMALQGSKLAALRKSATPSLSSAYEPAGIDAPVVSTRTWPEAPAQSSGPEWVFDVFTPPEIFFDTATSQFRVTPPRGFVEEVKVVPFGVTLASVRQDAFRLQLVGYIGEEGDYRGNFENAITGETIIGRQGKVFEDLGLKLERFDVKRNTIISADSMPIIDIEATALVVDMKTGESTTLTNKHRQIKGTPFAVLQVAGAAGPVEQKEGGTFTAGDATFTVLKVNAEPPSVEIRKESPELAAPETKTLTPVSAAPAGAADTSAPAPSTEQPSSSMPFPFGN